MAELDQFEIFFIVNQELKYYNSVVNDHLIVVFLDVKIIEIIRKVAQQWRSMSPQQKQVFLFVTS